jgi:murein DD-endopeptidase MepM/ murein hydrolase activator NlpD
MRKEIGLFLRAWYRFIIKKFYRTFTVFEKGKSVITSSLYRQRGRFATPFVHIGMVGLTAMGITIAPVLANSFPGLTEDQWSEVSPNAQVREVTDSAMTTEIPTDRVRDKVLEYEVKNGDTLSKIADTFGITVDTVLWENGMDKSDSIKPGQKLRILPVTGVSHKVGRGETIYSIAKKYSAEPQAMVDFPFNTFSDNETFALAVGQVIVVPDGKKPNVVPVNPSAYIAQRTPNAGAVSGTGRFVWPIGGTITQRFAWYHQGLDIATAIGTPVLAADSGTVTIAGWPDNSGYGNRVMIDHGNGFTTLYAHLSKISVVAGQTVNRGDRIGAEGSTGRSTGPHLHFEIRKGGKLFNPLNYLK